MRLESVRTFATTVLDLEVPIHVLVNNAGIMFGPRRMTEDGHESQLATNYIGHFLLTHLLLTLIYWRARLEDSRVKNKLESLEVAIFIICLTLFY